MSHVSFSSQAYTVSSSVSNDKLADVKWAGADSAVTTVTYRNAFTAFFGRAVSWIFDGGQNKALKENHFTDVRKRLEDAGIECNPGSPLFNCLSSFIGEGSRKPLSAYVVKKVEGFVENPSVLANLSVEGFAELVGMNPDNLASLNFAKCAEHPSFAPTPVEGGGGNSEAKGGTGFFSITFDDFSNLNLA